MSNFINELIKKAKEVTTSGLPFMQGLTKAEVSKNAQYTVVDYGFLQGETGDFICFTTAEAPNYYMFGGSVMTEKFKRLEEHMDKNDLIQLVGAGIIVKFEEKKSKNNRKYVDCVLFPEN